METIKDLLNFCNHALIYNHENMEIVEELDQIRKYIVKSFHKTILNTMIIATLSIIDDIILKIHDNDIEIIIENIHVLRENLLYKLSLVNLIKDNNGKLINGCKNKRII